MAEKGKKRFFASHAKSSAMMVSVIFHAILIIVAISFVAVKVITKDEHEFEAKPVARPKMQMKKLQVPVNVKKQRPKPKLRKRIVVKPKLDQSMPEIKLPEISGVKGGTASAGSGMGLGVGIGFNMPEIDVFGVKGKGERVFIILDSTPDIMVDEIGGIPAYTIIKDELIKILGNLNSTVLFNIAVYERSRSVVLFPKMVSASPENVARVEAWLGPLNAVRQNMGDKDYGVKTLGYDAGSKPIGEFSPAGKIQNQREFFRPAMLSMQERADAVFILTHGWSTLWHDVSSAEQFGEKAQAKYDQLVIRSEKMLREENEQRRSSGKPPRVFPHKIAMVKAYFPGAEVPPQPKRYHYTGKDIAEAMELTREATKPNVPATSGLGRKKRDKYSVNVIHFIQSGGGSEKDKTRFKELVQKCGGDYRTLSGLKAIRSSVSQE